MVSQFLPRPVSADDLVLGTGPLTVLYDDDCGVCRETIRQLRRWDRFGRFEFMPLDLAGSSGRPLLEQLAAEGHLADAIHVADESTGLTATNRHGRGRRLPRGLAP
jgi:predicted DCC family thiol-disulfide oxidoreductase YuxK